MKIDFADDPCHDIRQLLKDWAQAPPIFVCRLDLCRNLKLTDKESTLSLESKWGFRKVPEYLEAV